MSAFSRELKRPDFEHLIACEGVDAKFFLIRFFESDALRGSFFERSIKIDDFGSLDNLPRYLNSLNLSEESQKLKTLLIIRDMEYSKEPQAVMQSIRDVLKNAGFAVPSDHGEWSDNPEGPRTAFLLFPDFVTPCKGTLEDLCQQILRLNADTCSIEDAREYVSSLENKYQRSFKRKHKNHLHAFFSGTDDYVGLKVGEAAKAGAFDWGSEALKPLLELYKPIILECSK